LGLTETRLNTRYPFIVGLLNQAEIGQHFSITI
jgi:hypothetical protein